MNDSIKNGDLPANPLPLGGSRDEILSTEEYYGNPDCNGMTKREIIAMGAMQGLLSNAGGVVQANQMSGTGWCNCDEKGLAEWAVNCADALLRELEK